MAEKLNMPVSEFLRRRVAALQDIPKIAAEHALIFTERVKEHFTLESSAPKGEDWEELSESYAKRKKGPSILVETGALRSSIGSRVTSGDGSVTIHTGSNETKGINVEGGVAAVHQYGTRDGRIPARPFLAHQDADIEALQDDLGRALAGHGEINA